MVAAFERSGEIGDPEAWHRRLDGDGTPDRADQGADDRRGRRPETEAQAAERLGLTGLNRSDAYDSLRAKADAQEAEIRQRDVRARGENRDGPRDEAAETGQREDEPAEPERNDRGSGTPRDVEIAQWRAEPTEDRPDHDPERHPHYWTEVPRFQANWERLEERWPLCREGTDDSAHERRHDVSSEKRTEVLGAVADLVKSEPSVSDVMKQIERENAHGGRLEGFKFRVKGADRLTEKALDAIEAQPDSSPKEILDHIPDAIRYTFCFDIKDYTSGCKDIKDRLESSGYEIYQCKNFWDDVEYKGINTRWVTPEGQRVEVQFHTPESFNAKHEVTHLAYERIRGNQISRAERAELKEFQREVSSWVPVPVNVMDISSFKKEGF